MVKGLVLLREISDVADKEDGECEVSDIALKSVTECDVWWVVAPCDSQQLDVMVCDEKRREMKRNDVKRREENARDMYAPSAHEKPPSTGAHAAWPACWWWHKREDYNRVNVMIIIVDSADCVDNDNLRREVD